jgi:hypothetical protein
MPIIATAYSGNHQIVVEYSKSAKYWVTYDGRKVSETRAFSARSVHRFQVMEEGQPAYYEVKIEWERRNFVVNVRRNDILFFSTDPGFTPPPIQIGSRREQPSQEVHVKEVVREVILVVCPHCGHRNDANRRTCEKCQASI